MKLRRRVVQQFLRRTDVEILLETFEIHTAAIVLDDDAIRLDEHFYTGGVGIVGIVDKLAYQLDTLAVQPLAKNSDVALVNRNRQGCRWVVGDHGSSGLDLVANKPLLWYGKTAAKSSLFSGYGFLNAALDRRLLQPSEPPPRQRRRG